jgi:hypothetical protein
MKEATRKTDIGGRIVLNWILEGLEWGDMDWNDLAQDRDRQLLKIGLTMCS